MARVSLIRPPSVTTVGAYIASLTPPIGLAYLAGSLRADGHDVKIIDAVGEAIQSSTYLGNGLILRGLSFSEIIAQIDADVEIIGFSGMFSSEWVSLRPLLNMIGEKFPNALFIAGGEHFSAAPEICLDYCEYLDAIVLGEGEETICDIARSFDSGRLSLERINGLVIRSTALSAIGSIPITDTPNDDGILFHKLDKNKFIKTASRSRIRHIDEIPAPSWDLIPLETYLSGGYSYGVNRGRSMPMIASRGCPYQCTFCSNPYMWGTRWVSRNPKKVVDEIQEYIKLYQITNVDFYDLTAIVKKSWIKEFCLELIGRNLNITWQLPSGTRSEAIDEEVSELLFRSGCRNMNYAPESGSEKTLKEIKKKIKIEGILKSLRGAVKAGINVKMNIIIGFPHEKHLDVLKTLWLLVRLSYHGAHDVSIGVFAPYPGSELYHDLVKSGKITYDDQYWEKLAYVDISETISYSNYVSAFWLKFYNWAGFALFYGSNYFFRPSRALKTISNLLKNQHESRGEMALAQILARFRFVIFQK